MVDLSARTYPYYEVLLYSDRSGVADALSRRLVCPSEEAARKALLALRYFRYHGFALHWVNSGQYKVIDHRPPADPVVLARALERIGEEFYAMLSSHDLPGSRLDPLKGSSKDLRREITHISMTAFEALRDSVAGLRGCIHFLPSDIAEDNKTKADGPINVHREPNGNTPDHTDRGDPLDPIPPPKAN